MKIADRLYRVCAGLAWVMCAGCTVPTPTIETTNTDSGAAPLRNTMVQSMAHQPASPGFRYSRYTLVTPTAPAELLEQLVDITIPLSVNGEATTVLDALRYVLMRSGYQLCDSGEAIEVFRAWILPAAHVHLGPMSLRQILETMAGRAWTLRINEKTRVICFDAVISGGGEEEHDE